MRRHIEHAGPFIGYFTVCLAAAAFHLFLAPQILQGARHINGSPFTPVGSVFAAPLGGILCALPVVVVILFILSFRVSALRSAGSMAGFGCGVILLLLAYT